MALVGKKRGTNPSRDTHGRFFGLGGGGITGRTRVRGAGLEAQRARERGGDPDLAAALWARYNTKAPFPTAANDPRTGGNLTGVGYRKKR